MNKRFLSVLVFALVVAGGATILFYRLVAGRLTAAGKPASVQVIVASRDLAIGTLLKEVDLNVADWTGTVPAQAIPKKEDIVGRGVVQNIYTGEPIVETRLAARGAGAGLAATIPPGMRAVAVRVNDVVGVAGFVVPGMRVDLIVSGTPPGGSHAAGTLTRTILQNIQVLSAGQNIQKDNEGKPVSVPVISVLATPEQAEVLSLASNETRIQLVLRNPLDTKEAETRGIALSQIFTGRSPDPPKPPAVKVRRPVAVKPAPPGAPPVQVVPAPAPATVVVEVIQGSKRTEHKFQM